MKMTLRSFDEIKESACYRYAADCISAKNVVCDKVYKAAKRFLDDLEKSKDPQYRWCFDLDKAYRPINFMEEFLIPTKGDYERMSLRRHISLQTARPALTSYHRTQPYIYRPK